MIDATDEFKDMGAVAEMIKKYHEQCEEECEDEWDDECEDEGMPKLKPGPFNDIKIETVANGYLIRVLGGNARDVYVAPNLKALQDWLATNMAKTHIQKQFVEEL